MARQMKGLSAEESLHPVMNALSFHGMTYGTPLQVDLRDFITGRGQFCLRYIAAGNHI
jgi:hypothetical protein